MELKPGKGKTIRSNFVRIISNHRAQIELALRLIREDSVLYALWDWR